MLGSPPGTHRPQLVEAGVTPGAPKIDDAGSPGELLRRRLDLIVAERRLVASNARIGMAIAEYYPKLALSELIGSATSVSSGNLFTSGASQAAGVLGLRWRLFDFGRINAQIHQAKGQEAGMLAAYRLAVLRATEDVEKRPFGPGQARGAGCPARPGNGFARPRARRFVCGLSKGRRQSDRGAASRRKPPACLRCASPGANGISTRRGHAFTALGGGWQPERSEAVAIR